MLHRLEDRDEVEEVVVGRVIDPAFDRDCIIWGEKRALVT